MIRSKKRIARRRRLRKEGRLYDLPSNVSVKQLQPFPQYPPDQWVGDLDTSVKVFCLFSAITLSYFSRTTQKHTDNQLEKFISLATKHTKKKRKKTISLSLLRFSLKISLDFDTFLG